MKDVRIEVEGEEVKGDATTHPRWSLVPKYLKFTFDNLDRSVEGILAQFCVGRRSTAASAEGEEGKDDEVADGTGLVLRRGVYAVDAAHFPALKARMRVAR